MLTEKEIRAKRALLKESDKSVAMTFKALGDVTRLRIFRLLTDEPQITVSTIANILNISVPLTSQHIKVLVHAKLLEKTRTGKRVFTELDRGNPTVRELIRTIQRTLAAEP